MTTRKDRSITSSPPLVTSSARTPDGREIPVEVLGASAPAAPSVPQVKALVLRQRRTAVAIRPPARVARQRSPTCPLCGGGLGKGALEVRLGPLYTKVCRDCVQTVAGGMRIMARLFH